MKNAKAAKTNGPRPRTESLRIEGFMPAAPDAVFQAWLSSREHSAMTGARAVVSNKVGARHSAWDGYAQGKNLTLAKNRRIVQSWRTTEFPERHDDSMLDVRLSAAKGGTKIVLMQTGIPTGQGKSYREGWRDYYFVPMRAYFAKRAKA